GVPVADEAVRRAREIVAVLEVVDHGARRHDDRIRGALMRAAAHDGRAILRIDARVADEAGLALRRARATAVDVGLVLIFPLVAAGRRDALVVRAEPAVAVGALLAPLTGHAVLAVVTAAVLVGFVGLGLPARAVIRADAGLAVLARAIRTLHAVDPEL